MSEMVQPFEADVGRVLDIVINSLYRDREIFLRELISNASDACDKLRYESLSRPELLGEDPELAITILADGKQNTLTVLDNGIGMSRDELAQHLGTIARSGTARFLQQATGDQARDLKLIGQFGVGFYSVFMVADRVIVTSRRAGEDTTWAWASDGRTGFTIAEAPEPLARGTAVTLQLKDDAREFLEEWTIRRIVRTYSDHVGIPIRLRVVKADDKSETPTQPVQINAASAIWTRPKAEISDAQHKEFYHHTAHAFDEPFARVHTTAEGSVSYTALLYVPTQRPFDLFDPRRRHGVKLYVRRVFISDALETLLPRYLRFVAGVVDSEDLQLNVSRETLQHSAVIAKIRKTIVRKLLDELKARAEADPRAYEAFWQEFGAVLKEGLYEDDENRDRLLELLRVRSTHSDGWTSLAGYVERLRPGQTAIYWLGGENQEALRKSPQIEEARARGIEVLLFDDPVDEFWLPRVGAYQGKSLISLAKGDVDLSQVPLLDQQSGTNEPENPFLDKLLGRIKAALGEQVADVRASKRLRESAVCLVADTDAMEMRLERFLKTHNQLDALSKRVLEVNGRHALIRRLAELAQDETRSGEVEEVAQLLLDQARIVEGEPLPDPSAFALRLSRLVERGLAA